MKNILSKNFVNIFIATLFACIFAPACNGQDHSSWQSDYCKIVRIVPGRSGGRMFVYYVDSNEYHGWTGRGFDGAALGDVYKILYNPENPKEYEWLDELPYFLQTDNKAITTGEVIYASEPNLDKLAYVKYRYRVDGKSYDRVQCVPLIQGIQILKGDKYSVLYSPDNIQRSIIVPQPKE